MTERTEHDRATRAFAGWLLKHPDATNTDRQTMKAQLGLTRDGPGMLVAVSDRIEPLPFIEGHWSDADKSAEVLPGVEQGAPGEDLPPLSTAEKCSALGRMAVSQFQETASALTAYVRLMRGGHWPSDDDCINWRWDYARACGYISERGEVPARGTFGKTIGVGSPMLPGGVYERATRGAYSNEAPTEYLTLEKLSAAYDNINRYATDAAMALLVDWLTKPGTVRSVSHMARSEATGKWFVALTAGGFAFESETQETLSGAIRSALYAAELGAR